MIANFFAIFSPDVALSLGLAIVECKNYFTYLTYMHTIHKYKACCLHFFLWQQHDTDSGLVCQAL